MATIGIDIDSIRFGAFTTSWGQRRIYVNGTTREKIYYTEGEGCLESSVLPGWYMNSDALRPQRNTSSVYVRRTKDLHAFECAAQAILARYGKVSFDEVWNAISK